MEPVNMKVYEGFNNAGNQGSKGVRAGFHRESASSIVLRSL